jgi:uncharacterized protein YciI
MLYVVILTYIRPIEEVHAHLDSHRDWLIEHSKSGNIVVAGPLEDRKGGAVLACCKDRAELDNMLARDSFHIHGLVDYEVRAFSAALRAEAFPKQWAPEAKAV